MKAKCCAVGLPRRPYEEERVREPVVKPGKDGRRGPASRPHFFLEGVPSGPTLHGHKRQPRHENRLSDTLTQPLEPTIPSPSTFLERFSFSKDPARNHPLRSSFPFGLLSDSISLLSKDLRLPDGFLRSTDTDVLSPFGNEDHRGVFQGGTSVDRWKK